MNCSRKLPILLMFVLLFFSQIQNAAETKTAVPTDAAASTEISTEDTTAERQASEEKAVEISHSDTTEAGKAKHAFLSANLCKGMAEGDYLGTDVCADCHQDKIETMHASPHGQSVDSRTPFGRQGCETCH